MMGQKCEKSLEDILFKSINTFIIEHPLRAKYGIWPWDDTASKPVCFLHRMATRPSLLLVLE